PSSLRRPHSCSRCEGLLLRVETPSEVDRRPDRAEQQKRADDAGEDIADYLVAGDVPHEEVAEHSRREAAGDDERADELVPRRPEARAPEQDDTRDPADGP